MRRDEILGLIWEDIDFDQRIVHVRHNAIIGKGETSIRDALKTEAGRRDLALTEELEEWLLKRKQISRSKFVLDMKNGKPLTQSSYKSMWNLVERELPDTHVTAHILRHTCVTRLFEAGLDIKEVQYLAGHSTVDMTLRVYTHYDRRSREGQTVKKVREAMRDNA